MKKLSIFSAMALIAFISNAQVKPSTNKGGFMLKGGVNLANISVTDDGRVDEANGITSFHAGIGIDLPLSDGLSLQPGLLLSGKGAKTQMGQTTDATYWKATSTPLYVELPLNLVGKIPLSEYTRVYIGAGGYAAAGVGGKNEREG
ncbi:MAG TPA: outer membrane beta-barrel protein, partial [Segetibacter sp.]